MEWTDIFSGPAFEPVKSRELHLGKDCDLSRPLVVRDTDKLTVEVAGGAALRLVVLHTKPCQAEVRIKLLEGADAELVQLFSAEAFVDFSGRAGRREQVSHDGVPVHQCECALPVRSERTGGFQ